MDHNLILPFILRESSQTVNDTAMIHLNKPSIGDYAIIPPNSDLSIRIHLHGTFSCFSTRMPTPDEILDPDFQVVVITPEGDSWITQCNSYQLKEEAHIDYYGNLTQSHHMTPNLIEDTDIHLDSVRTMAAEANVPYDFFPDKSDPIDNIITSTPRFANLERAP